MTKNNISIFGKIPPQAVEIEKAIIGCILLEKDAFGIVSSLITKNALYEPKNAVIFEVCNTLYKQNEPIDLLTVVNGLDKIGKLKEIGGAYELSKMTNSVVSSANLETHCKIILQKKVQRDLIQFGMDLANTAYDENADAFNLVDTSFLNLGKISGILNVSSTIKRIGEGYMDFMNRLLTLKESKNNVSGLRTDHKRLDWVMNGLQQTDLIILAARPSVGKSAFVQEVAETVSRVNNKAVLFTSLEMSNSQLLERMIANKGKIELNRLKNGKVNDNEINFLNGKFSNDILNSNLYVDDTAMQTIYTVCSKIKKFASEHGSTLVVVDYLQLATAGNEGKNGNREQEVSLMSRMLKVTAKETGCTIICLSQLSRAVETRGTGKDGSKCPQLSDLRESGAIEQDADIVWFLHKKEVQDSSGTVLYYTQLFCAKHRNGELFKLDFHFAGMYQSFKEVAFVDDTNQECFLEREFNKQNYIEFEMLDGGLSGDIQNQIEAF